MKVCGECGAALSDPHYNQRYCSSECRRLVKNKISSKYKPTTEQTRHRKYRQRYGISWEQVQDLLAKQELGCAVCRRTLSFEGTKGRDLPVVDHCHSTGKVRGLLCTPCNLMLGYSYDDASVLEAAIRYLKENNN